MMRSLRIGILTGLAAAAVTLLPTTASADPIEVSCPAVAPTLVSCGVTVQLIDDDNESLDPEVFAFFKGLNDPADGNGELTVLVEAGLR